MDAVRPVDGARAQGAEVTPPVGKITYFESPAHFRRWLEKHHSTETVLWVGFHKRASGTPSLTWPESVDQALCFGWIDGVRKRVDDTRYTIRFSPRKAPSSWSAINVKRARELIEENLMTPAGRAAFDARTEDKTGLYSYENRPAELDPAYAKTFRRDKAAWAFFQAQPPSYRKMASWWVTSAKQEETRQKRLARLMANSAARKRI